MTITDLIEQLEELEKTWGDLHVELDSGSLVSDVDAMFVGEDDKNPSAIVIK